jgi:hypothetical protein
MKKWTSALSVFVAVAMLSTSAFAAGGAGSAGGSGTTGGGAGATGGAGGGAGQTGTSPSPGGAATTDSPAASPAKPGAADAKGEHTMTGEVTKIDQKKGHVSLKTAEGTFNLHFPPAALKDVKQGDRLTVELGIKDVQSAAGGAGAPAASPRGEKTQTQKTETEKKTQTEKTEKKTNRQ